MWRWRAGTDTHTSVTPTPPAVMSQTSTAGKPTAFQPRRTCWRALEPGAQLPALEQVHIEMKLFPPFSVFFVCILNSPHLLSRALSSQQRHCVSCLWGQHHLLDSSGRGRAVHSNSYSRWWTQSYLQLKLLDLLQLHRPALWGNLHGHGGNGGPGLLERAEHSSDAENRLEELKHRETKKMKLF